MEKDYKNLARVLITCQAEMDDVPDGYAGNIYINASEVITVKKEYYGRVVAKGNSSVVAINNARICNCSENSNIMDLR